MDEARLGNALMAENNNLSLADISQLTDVFYIGGTKNGALLGETIVFNNQSLAPEFDYVLKQKGALLQQMEPYIDFSGENISMNELF